VRRLNTRARKVWPKGHKKPKVIRGLDLALPAGVASRYARKLQKMAEEMTRTTQREITALFRHPDVQDFFANSGMDISPASQARILTNKLKERFDQLFGAAAGVTAATMAEEANEASEAAVNMSLRELSKGLTLSTKAITPAMKEFLKASIANNVSLIKSIPSEFFRDVQQAVLSSITDGKGLDDLTKFFENQHGVQSRRAKNIAVDQTHKAYNGLNRDRLKSVGVSKFEWLHSGGGLHPRQHHIDPWPIGLNGGIFSYDALPVIEPSTGERGIPGQAINCRCTIRPVVDFDDAEQPGS
jgi:SPP1 gp7 family putative phage head morphogenesis protein